MNISSPPTTTATAQREALAADLVDAALDTGVPRIVVARRSEHVLDDVRRGERLSTWWDAHPGAAERSSDWARLRAAREQRLGLGERTVYGTLVVEQPGTPVTSRFTGDSFYGDVAFVVGESANARATLAPGDTLDNEFASTSPFSAVREVLIEALLRRDRWMTELESQPISDARNAVRRLFANPGSSTVVEAQVDALRLDELVEVRSRLWGMPGPIAVFDAARARGIAVPASGAG